MSEQKHRYAGIALGGGPCKPGVSGPHRAGTVGAQKSANRLGPGSSFCSLVVHPRQEARQGGEIVLHLVKVEKGGISCPYCKANGLVPIT